MAVFLYYKGNQSVTIAMIKQLLLCATCFLLFGCPQRDDGYACTLELVYGLSITVKDAVSGNVITENITVTAVDGDYSEELMAFPSSSNFAGAGERPGIYLIQVSAEGYEEFTSESISVGSDECHVIPEARTFELQPL